MVDHAPGSAVVQEVAELLGHIAVVHVERGDAGSVRAEHPLDVLVAVVQVEGEVVLAGLPPLELWSLLTVARLKSIGSPWNKCWSMLRGS